IGLDIGGTKILAAIANPEGKIIKQLYRETPISLTDGLKVLDDIINELSCGERISGIGIAIGGPLDHEKGIVSPLHQPEWRNVPLKQIMEDRWHCPVYIDVDTNVAALGEYRLTNEKFKRFLYLTISTGMGGGFILNGKIYRGSNGIHPEPGHISINYRCL
ncbi:MAG TPA: ROK family protein, partial [Victivallales bacterium]|nr:ROK family protein [Victivallales bacterium]